MEKPRSLLPICYRFVTDLKNVSKFCYRCYRFVTALLPLCYRFYDISFFNLALLKCYRVTDVFEKISHTHAINRAHRENSFKKKR